MITSQLKQIMAYAYIVIILLLFLANYHTTLLSLHFKWVEWDGPYAHSYLIIGAIAYFIFERRHELKAENWQPCVLALPFLFIGVCLWQAGSLSLILSLEQLSLPLILFTIVTAINGIKIARQLLPFFLLLLLTLPLWDILIPFLRLATVIVNTQLLNLISLPVNIEEFHITIPAGVFHVASGCSGLSHMMTILTTAALFAIEFKTKKLTTFKLFGLAVILGMMSNWVRVFGLIMLGHTSNMQNPIVNDHGDYGLIINGVFIVIYCFICIRYIVPNKPAINTSSRDEHISTKYLLTPQTAIIIATIISLPLLIQWQIHSNSGRLSVSPAMRGEALAGWATIKKGQEKWELDLKQHDFSRSYHWKNRLDQLEVHITGYNTMSQQKKINPHTFNPIPKGWKHNKTKENSVIINKEDSYALLKHHLFLNNNVYNWEGNIRNGIIESQIKQQLGIAIISTIQPCQLTCQNELLHFDMSIQNAKNFTTLQLHYKKN